MPSNFKKKFNDAMNTAKEVADVYKKAANSAVDKGLKKIDKAMDSVDHFMMGEYPTDQKTNKAVEETVPAPKAKKKKSFKI